MQKKTTMTKKQEERQKQIERVYKLLDEVELILNAIFLRMKERGTT
jgi:hypothetical protein